MTQLQQKYQNEVVESLKKELGITNPFAVPRILKVVVNMGVSDPHDPRERRRVIENVMDQFTTITGQKSNMTVARKSIAGFKLRVGDPLGAMVTLRGQYMWGFLQKLISVALPRVKDFRGVSSTAFDGHGNYSMGIEEQIIFPEIEYDKIDKIRSLQVGIVTTATNDAHALALLQKLGMPFAKQA